MRVTRIRTDTTTQLVFEEGVDSLGYVPGDTVEITGPKELAGVYLIVSANVMDLLEKHREPNQTKHQGNPQVNKPWYRAMKHGNKYGRK